MTEAAIMRRIRRLYASAPIQNLTKDDRLVVISDLHMGDGGKLDDFRHNGDLLLTALKEYYLPGGFHLLLNGDIEELQRFAAPRIREQWAELFHLFNAFHSTNGLTRLVGNHDLSPGRFSFDGDPPGHALRLRSETGEIFVFHGHQASRYGPLFNRLKGWVLRWIASPLRIRNYTVAFNSRRKYRYEKRAYQFARNHRIMALIGHTHRPLFESMSRLDTLKMQIESACRELARTFDNELAKKTNQMKVEFFNLARSRKRYAGQSMLYDHGLLVPCLFNSGSGIGTGGITAIEFDRGKVNLVLWFLSSRNKRYMNVDGRKAQCMAGADVHRIALKTDDLGYILTRIRLLS